MLIQITNSCHMGCPHCMQDSKPGNTHMSIDLFKFIVDNFGDLSPLIITGGEPTEHPDFTTMMEYLDSHGTPFVIASNGSFAFNGKLKEMEKVLSLSNLIDVQIYSNKLWYKDHDKTVEFFHNYKNPKILLDTSDIRSMQDLGRARTSEKAQEMIDKSPYHMSCLNANLLARQGLDFKSLVKTMHEHFYFCTPAIDYLGNIHLSESILCPSVANIKDDLSVINEKLSWMKPCGKCKGFKKFKESSSVKLVLAKHILS